MPRYSAVSEPIQRPGAEDGVDVAQREPRVGERVARRLGVQHEGRLVRQLAVLVRLARADDRDAAAHVAQRRGSRAAPAGRKCGSAISGVASTNVTSTGMPMRICAGSGSTPTRFVIMRGPSSSSTIASTYGGREREPLLPALHDGEGVQRAAAAHRLPLEVGRQAARTRARAGSRRRRRTGGSAAA